MATREIVIHEDPLLRKKSRHVRKVTPALQALVDDMVETMHTAGGIGLAAVQVGVPERVVVVQLRPDPEDEQAEPGELYAVLNPKLARTSREVEEGIEGCLSVPGWVGSVERHSAVTVKGLDARGKPVRVRAEGLLARVFQHEIDHCDGVLFLDHIEDPEKLWAVIEGEEEAAEATQQVPAAARVDLAAPGPS